MSFGNTNNGFGGAGGGSGSSGRAGSSGTSGTSGSSAFYFGTTTTPPVPTTVKIYNSTGFNLNNFVALANGSNITGLTAVTLIAGTQTNGTTPNLSVGSGNTIVISNSTFPIVNMTVNTIKEIGLGTDVTFTQTGAGTPSVTISLTLTTSNIFNGIIIDLI